MKNVELLSPAGNLEKLKIAIEYGANAVYIGGKNFSLRANAANFSIDDIRLGVVFAHEHNAKVYVTVNILFHNHDFEGLADYLKSLEEVGVDAIIIADVAVLQIMKENNVNLEVHLSTQLSNINYESITYYKSLGVTRVVLGREATREDIKSIKEHVDIEIETFIHGAMCTSYSGRCVMSNYFTNRDSNRGGCSQICRFDFKLYNDDTLIDHEDNFSMCSKDLSMITYLRELIELGISSFKIEGRMRSNYYIASVVSAYRQALDDYYNNKEKFKVDDNIKLTLERCANREAVVQFFDKEPGVFEQYYNNRTEVSNQDFLALVIDYDEINKELIISQRNYFKVNDEVVVFGPSIKPFKLLIKQIINEQQETQEIANHPEQILRIPCDVKVKPNSMLRVKWENE